MQALYLGKWPMEGGGQEQTLAFEISE